MTATPHAPHPAQSVADLIDTALRAPVAPPTPTNADAARAIRSRLHAELDEICGGTRDLSPRATAEAALACLADMQVVGTNLDACNPPDFPYLARVVARYADDRLQGQSDAIERGLHFANDATMRKLTEE